MSAQVQAVSNRPVVRMSMAASDVNTLVVDVKRAAKGVVTLQRGQRLAALQLMVEHFEQQMANELDLIEAMGVRASYEGQATALVGEIKRRWARGGA